MKTIKVADILRATEALVWLVSSLAPPQVVAPSPADTREAMAWIEAHYETLRGQWVAVRLRDPALLAQAPTLTQLWQVAAPATLQDCLIYYVSTVTNEQQVPGLGWDA